MNEIVKNKTAKFFSKYAFKFNRHYEYPNLIDNLFRKDMFLRYKMALETCQPIEGKRIVDIGCGTGIYDFELAKKGVGFILGIDFSKGMIDFAKQKSLQLGLEDKCHFIQADFFHPPLPNEEIFDYAIATGIMDYIASPSEFIKNILQVTKTRAFFSFPKGEGILGWQRKIRYKFKCPLFLYTKEQVDGLFKEIEAKNINIVDVGRGILVTVEK